MVRTLDFRKLAKAAAIAVDEKKADGVVVLDVRTESDVSDYVVIAGANSSAQLRALFETVEDTLLELGVKALRRDGRERGRWVAIDYGGLIVHVMLSEAREFFRLEQLWERAKSVKWQGRAHRAATLHTL